MSRQLTSKEKPSGTLPAGRVGPVPAAARQLRFWAALGACLAVLLLLPSVLTGYRLFYATVVLCYVIVAVGLNVVMGYSGQISVAHAALMGIGAYTTVLISIHLTAPVLLAVLAGAAVSTVVGCIVAIPALRIKGHYLALATLAFQLIAETIISNWVDVTGGPNGLAMPVVDIFGLALNDQLRYWLIAAIALMMVIFARNLARSRFGRALIALRDNDLVARVMGIQVAKFKTQAFAISAFYAGLGGGLFAVAVGFLDPGAFTVWESVRLLVMVVLGGLSTVIGPVLGGIIVGGAPEALSEFQDNWPIIYFVTLIVVLIFLPIGVTGGLQKVLARFLPAQLVRSSYERGVAIQHGRQTPRVAEPDGPAGDGPTSSPRAHSREATASPHEGAPLLRVRNVSLRFGGLQALKNVDLDVCRGEIVGLIGPNGAGKTSLFNVISRVITPDSGSVEFDGTDLLGYRTHQVVGLGMSRTFQNVELCASMSVAENVIIGMHHRLRSSAIGCAVRTPRTIREEAQASREARELLSQLKLSAYADTPVGELPIGLQRRVEVARALAGRPKLILLDEPASGLSHAEAIELMADVRDLQRRGIGVLIIEHNVQFVMELCDRITVLDEGEVIFRGTPEAARRDPRVIEAYLGKEESPNVAH